MFNLSTRCSKTGIVAALACTIGLYVSATQAQVDYFIAGGQTKQAEDQTYNTGVYQNGACGGGNGHSEWLHCNGAIGF